MKKIVGILAAAAVMASSAFAVDVASMLQIDGDLFNYSKDGVKAIMLKDYDPSGTSDYVWKLSTSGDAAGAEIWTWNLDCTLSQYTLWFKPVDSVKVSIGNVGAESIANPQFGWWAKNIADWNWGYQVEYTIDALSLKFAMEPGKADYWITPSAAPLFDSNAGWDSRNGKIGAFWLGANYGTSIGTVQAVIASGATVGAHGYSNWQTSALAFDLALANMPYLQTGYYADVAVTLGYKANDYSGSGDDVALGFQGVDAQIGGQWGKDALLIQETNLIQYRKLNAYSLNKNGFTYGFEAKVSYGIGNYKPYIQIGGYDIFGKKLTVDAGVATSFGGCSVTAWVDLPLDFNEGAEFSFSVPVEFSINL